MLLGVVLHASLFLIPDAWPVEDAWAATVAPEKNPYIYLLSAIHGFRMPVFFLLSGFFTAMLWQRRGVRSLAEHRLKRIGIPLALGAVTIIPINAWVMEPDAFSILHWPLVWWYGFHHLWFLWLLLLLAAAFLVAVRLGLRFEHPLWWLATPATLAPQFLMREPVFGPDTSVGLAPDPVVLGYYALFFAFGSFAYSANLAVRRWWAVAIVPSALALLPGMFYTYEAVDVPGRALAAVLQAGYAWCMCFGSLGLFRWLASRERAWVRYLSDASYWIYLWHLPLVVAGQRLIVDWPLGPHLKFGLICFAVPTFLLVVYGFGVRYTAVGTMLNGRRVRRPNGQAVQPSAG